MRSPTTLLALSALLAACVQPPQPAPQVDQAQAAAAAPTPAAAPSTFLAQLLSLEGCAPGEALFAIPWQHSPKYDPYIIFVRAPDPVPVCVPYPAKTASASIG